MRLAARFCACRFRTSISMRPRSSFRKRREAPTKRIAHPLKTSFPRRDRLYVIDIVGGPSRVRVFDKQGKALPAPVTAASFGHQAKWCRSAAASCFSTSPRFLSPRPGTALTPPPEKQPALLPVDASSVNFDDAEVVRDFATSKDGTRVPLNIIRRKGTNLDGTHPALLTGYGGYGISTKPTFSGSFARLWLDQGGIFVETNLRGGAEYGEEWHQAGKLTHKQNVFDDFLACAQYLIDQKLHVAGATRRSSEAATAAC